MFAVHCRLFKLRKCTDWMREPRRNFGIGEKHWDYRRLNCPKRCFEWYFGIVSLVLFFFGKGLWSLVPYWDFRKLVWGSPISLVGQNLANLPKKTWNYSRFITKTLLYNFDPLKPHFYIVKLGLTGVYIIFLISAQNINCGYSLEPPHRSMFWAEIWKISESFIWKFSRFWL